MTLAIVLRAARACSLGCVLLLMSCRPVPPRPLAPACPDPRIDTSGWRVMQGSSFQLRLPPDYREIPRRGIDSRVGEFRGRTGRTTYDLGLYTMRVSRESHPVADLCTDTIGGRTAQIATFLEPRTRRYAAHARWSLGRNEMGEHALGIYASATDPRFHEQMLAILRSVEFVGAPAPSP